MSTRKAESFNRDTIVADTVVQLIKDMNIDCIVETGTYTGKTTAFLAEQFPSLELYTVEVQFETFLIAEKTLKQFSNCKQFCSSSEKMLEKLLPTLTANAYFFIWMRIGKIIGLYLMNSKRFQKRIKITVVL